MFIITFCFNFVPIFGLDNEISGLGAGDEYFYEINKFEIPWKHISTNNISFFAPIDLVVNLTNTDLIIVVNKFNNYSDYDYSSYFSVLEAIKINYPINLDTNLKSILGDEYIISKDNSRRKTAGQARGNGRPVKTVMI